jgi:hypothetical protein
VVGARVLRVRGRAGAAGSKVTPEQGISCGLSELPERSDLSNARLQWIRVRLSVKFEVSLPADYFEFASRFGHGSFNRFVHVACADSESERGPREVVAVLTGSFLVPVVLEEAVACRHSRCTGRRGSVWFHAVVMGVVCGTSWCADRRRPASSWPVLAKDSSEYDFEDCPL